MSGQLERLDRAVDFDVDPDTIEQQLAALWREASEGAHGDAAVTRACLWNVIAYVPCDAVGEAQTRLRDAMRRLPAHLANRTLVLDVGPEEPDRPPLDAWVSANCLRAEGGGKLVCSEEVTLAARGDGRRHLPSLVRALLVPGVPTAFVVAGVPDPDDPLSAAMLRATDRVLLDGDVCSRPDVLADAAAAVRAGELGGMDLGWLRRAPLRAEVAALFDPPAGQAELETVRRVFVSASLAEASTGRLVLGWALGALGARDVRPDGGSRWRANRDAGELEIVLEVGDAHEALTIRFDHQDGDSRKVRCGSRLTSSGPGACPDRPTAGASLEALIARGLATRSEDPAYLTALESARRLT